MPVEDLQLHIKRQPYGPGAGVVGEAPGVLRSLARILLFARCLDCKPPWDKKRTKKKEKKVVSRFGLVVRR